MAGEACHRIGPEDGLGGWNGTDFAVFYGPKDTYQVHERQSGNRWPLEYEFTATFEYDPLLEKPMLKRVWSIPPRTLPPMFEERFAFRIDGRLQTDEATPLQALAGRLGQAEQLPGFWTETELAARRDEQLAGYYDTDDTSSQESLRQSLHEIIDDHQRFPYTSGATDTWDVLELADELQAEA